MYREYAFYTLAVRDAPDGECRVQTTATAAKPEPVAQTQAE